jgi:glycosyltransferase involved in cell wall biosynthesis
MSALEDLLCHHAGAKNPVTRFKGAPCEPPVLITADALAFLAAEVPIGARLSKVLQSLEALSNAPGVTAPLPVAWYAPVTEGEREQRKWPYRLDLDLPQDVIVLRRLLKLIGSQTASMYGAELLDAWHIVSKAPQQTVQKSASRARKGAGGTGQNDRILFAQSPSALTGVEQVMITLAAGLQKAPSDRFTCSVLMSLSGTVTDKLRARHVTVRTAERDFAYPSVSNYKFSREVLEALSPAVVHAHTVVGLPFCCAVVDHPTAFIQHVHVADEASLVQLREQLSVASKVLAVSEFVKRRVVRLGIRTEKIVVVYNGVSIPPDSHEREITRARLRRKLGIQPDHAVVLMVARFAANKRHDVAVNAFRMLHERLPGAVLLLVGEPLPGEEAVHDMVMSQISLSGVGDKIKLLGYLAEIHHLYQLADVMILPSEDDPAPLVLMEAMAHGLAVVAADSGGSSELVCDRRTGLLIQPGSAEAFASALEEILTERGFRRTLVDHALVDCKQRFSEDAFVQRVADVYRHVLDRPSRD